MTPLIVIVALVTACGDGKNSEKDDCLLEAGEIYLYNAPDYAEYMADSDLTTKGIEKAQEKFNAASQVNLDRFRSALSACGLSDSEVEELLNS